MRDEQCPPEGDVSADGDSVVLTRDGGVAVIRLNRPPLNPFDDDLTAGLRACVSDLTSDDSVRACVLWGGPTNFAAGADITRLAAMDFEEVVLWNARLQSTFTSVAELPFPVVAAVMGYCLGGGLELAMCADYRVGATTAKVGQPEVKLGIIPGSGGTQRLTRIVGRSRAKQILMTGRLIDASEARSLRLLDEVLSPEDVFDRSVNLAAELARGPRFAIRAIKEAVDSAEPSLESGLALERSLIAGLFATRDRSTGMESFLSHGPGKARFD